MAPRVETLNRERFSVSPTRGFLPDVDPLPSFEANAHPFLRTLDDLGRELPDLLERSRLRSTLRDLEAPPADLFDDLTDRELVRAYALSGFLANAHIHALDAPAVDSLPAGAAVPLYESTKRLGRTPVLSYDAYALHNWARADSNRGLAPHNVRSLTNFVTLRDEQWFIAVHVAIEAATGPAIATIGDAQQGVLEADDARVSDALHVMEDAVRTVNGLLDRMREHNSPERYGRGFRPYLASFHGVTYEGVDELDGEQAFRGASGAQSSLFPALDAALGVDHGANALVDHLHTLRRDMPPSHRAFIEAAEDGPSVYDYAADSTDESLREAYAECLDQIIAFRERHVEVVRTYLTNPLGETEGTGGTPYSQYLDQFVEDTRAKRL